MSLRKMILSTVAAIAVSGALSVSAFAAPIAAGSQLNITGFDIGQGGGGTINTATGLDFTTSTLAPSPGVAGTLDSVTGGGIGSFAGLHCSGNCGSIQDILNFASFTPITGFYSTAGLAENVSFDLNTIGNFVRMAATSTSLALLSFSGTGIIHFDGFDPTPGIFTLTTQGNNVTTFSASTVAQLPVPEPMTLAILGAGLLGLGAIRRRRSQAKA